MKGVASFILLFLFASAVAFSQGLAIRPFVDIGESELGELVADYISVELIRSRQLSVISPSSVSAQLKEAKIIESGCSSAECNIAVAELLQTDYLVFGTVEKRESGFYRISYQIYRTIRKSVIHTKNVSMTFDSINDSVRDIAEDILHWTTGRKMKLIEHSDYDNVNKSALHGKVTGINLEFYTLNAGWDNGLKKNSYVYVMNGEEIGAVLEILSLLPGTSVARLVMIKSKGFKIELGASFYIPEKIDRLRFIARNRLTAIVSIPFSSFGVRYEYGMRYRFKPSLELSIGTLSAFAGNANWYLYTWLSIHLGVGIFAGDLDSGDSLEWYPSLIAGFKLSLAVLSGYIIEADVSAFGQGYVIMNLGAGVTF